MATAAADHPTIIFVHLGSTLPAWLGTTLEQARRFNSCPIMVLADAGALARTPLPLSLSIARIPLQDLPLTERQREFRDVSPLDRTFRDGFWTFTSERFFVLESAMRTLGLREVIHLENDVMLYCDCVRLAPLLSELYPSIAATFDNDTRCVPGFVYLKSSDAAGLLTSFFLDVFRSLRRSGHNNGVNDMMVLGALSGCGPEAIESLPIVPPDYPRPLRSVAGHVAAEPGRYSRHFAALGMIFDAAALGQYLGGIDPRNAPGSSVGFVNESCVFDPRLLRPRFVHDPDGRRVPVVETASGQHAVANLHVHSKNPQAFRS